MGWFCRLFKSFKWQALLLMAIQRSGGESVILVEGWVFEGTTTAVAFHCREESVLKNFMK
jgi:hypothetical protein